MALSKVGGNQIDTVSGDLTVDTNTLVVDATSNDVGIGTTTPNKSSSSNALTVNTGTAANYAALELSSNDTLNWYINANNAAVYDTTQGTRSRIFFTNGSERLRILSSGGLTFNGDTAAANALDDYEEGSWTPGIATGTVGTSYAYYTKVGNLVTLNVNLHTFSDRTSTNAIGISGLPFTTSSNNRAVGAVMHRYIDDSGEDVTSWVEANVSAIKFYLNSQSSNWVQLKHNDLMSASAQIYMTITYQAA